MPGDQAKAADCRFGTSAGPMTGHLLHHVQDLLVRLKDASITSSFQLSTLATGRISQSPSQASDFLCFPTAANESLDLVSISSCEGQAGPVTVISQLR